ncbi:hypothetical protein OKA05_22270 [Luteolibacter arcticus]|uniref:Uncharacterized protein n=1 Tax=Luteolibacter arcticus TaxID=1581411 RepID=A0ABT3GP58_9BACT|nr:hypothetical protein [Luteolibacter arcticus]MCW1925302.1 hypothetical protein [Luteolibacter arcticus]
MIRPFVIATLLAAPLAADEAVPAADLLRFTNGNQIDGRFAGMDSGGVVTWTRPDVTTPMPFQREKIRQIVLRNARPLSAMADPCHVTLINGDRIPGKVVAADEDNVTIETTVAGTMVLPREAVAVVAPNPFGGRLLYAGPFDDKGWNLVRSDGPVVEPDPFAGNFRAPLPLPLKLEDEDKDKPSWVHTGASWYSRGGAADAITLDAGLPDRALLRFKLGWRSRPSISVAFHADLQRPEVKEKEGEAEEEQPRLNFGGMQHLPRLFGTGYVINFQTGFVYLQRTWFDDEGQPKAERFRNSNTSVRLPDTGEAVFEIRCDRQQGTITVHIDGEFAVQWNTTDEGARVGDDAKPGRPVTYHGPGSGIGFIAQGNSAPVRISDIIVAEWNGLTDSARSMESDHRDIALLANGTDRFSGRVLAIRGGMAEIDASYGPLKVPMADIAEIHFARDRRRKTNEAPASEIAVHLQPVGRISGTPLASANGRIQLESALAGKIDLDLAPAVILEFQAGGGFLDEWDDEQ